MKKAAMILATMMLAGGMGAQAQLLWKVERPGSDKVSYVFGTHHFAPVTMIDSVAGLNDALKGVDRLYGELDMAHAMQDQAGMQQKMITTSMDSTIDKVLSPAAMSLLQETWTKYTGGQMPLQSFYVLKPAAMMMQLESGMAMEALPGFNPNEQLDTQMQTNAKALGKPVAGLETMEQQLDMLLGRPISAQAHDLEKFLKDLDKEKENVRKLTDAYLKQDLPTLYGLIMEADAEDPDALQRMIYDRNDNWVRQLKDEMRDESLMVVVGAGHLPGDKGVLQGLRDAGYKVTEVK